MHTAGFEARTTLYAGFLTLAILLSGAANAATEAPALPQSLAEAVNIEQADALPLTAFYDASSMKGTQPGALLRRASFSGYALPPGASAVRILYHSRDAADGDVVTSGVVLIPAGPPPAGGWPLIAWAHGTSGVARACAPSLEKDLEYGEEGLGSMVGAGFAVVATDYHGLGTAGPHQYVNKVAQGRDVIFSVPAARAAVPSLGSRWVAVGHSQGGLAAWGVAELEATYQDPNYLGAISLSGAADIRSLLAGMGGPDNFGAFYLVYMAWGVHALTPTFQVADMLDGDALERYPDASTKGCWYSTYATFLGKHSAPILKPDWQKNPAVQHFFAGNTLGRSPIFGPLLVMTGEADQTVPFPLVKAKVHEACANGIPLSFRSYPGLDHDPTMGDTIPDQLSWIRDRFAGKPMPSNCAEIPR